MPLERIGCQQNDNRNYQTNVTVSADTHWHFEGRCMRKLPLHRGRSTFGQRDNDYPAFSCIILNPGKQAETHRRTLAGEPQQHVHGDGLETHTQVSSSHIIFTS